MHKKRMVLTSEPEDNAKLRMSLIKDLTGGATFNARQLYQAMCAVQICMLLVLECNKKPELSGRIDRSVLERIIDIPFVSTFTVNESEWDKNTGEKRHYYPVDPTFKSSEFQEKHKHALFEYIAEQAPEEIEAPDVVKLASREYVIDSDEVHAWFEENYESTGRNTDVIDMKKVHSLYMVDNKYTSYNTQKKFKQFLESSCAFEGIFFTDPRKINGGKYTNRFVGFIPKVDDDDGIEEDE